MYVRKRTRDTDRKRGPGPVTDPNRIDRLHVPLIDTRVALERNKVEWPQGQTVFGGVLARTRRDRFNRKP